MKDVFVESFNLFSPLGIDAAANYRAVIAGQSAVENHSRPGIFKNDFLAAVIDDQDADSSVADYKNYTRFEKMLIASITEVLSHSKIDIRSNNTLIVFSTTKGNIGLLEENPDKVVPHSNLYLYNSATKIAGHFGNHNQPVVISNACISGVVALIYASRLLRSGKYKHIVVAGADTHTRFVHSGFQSFQALSPGTCKPFSADRDGINLGEAAATIILTSDSTLIDSHHCVKVLSGSVTNDSNHISGPSRTGEELGEAISRAIIGSGITASDIGFISAHGTATPFNDEMEAKAFGLAGLSSTPVTSLKGVFGHTLGAAGLVESVMNIMAMRDHQVPPTYGFSGHPVVEGMNISNKKMQISPVRYLLKTASGFGGCNAAIVFQNCDN